MATLQQRICRLELAGGKGNTLFVCKDPGMTEEEALARYFLEHPEAIGAKELIYIQLPVADPAPLPDGYGN